MSKTKNQRRLARLAAEAKAERMGVRTSRGAHNPRGPVVAARIEGPGVVMRCNRCGAVTVGGAKHNGSACRMTRGCKGHLLATGDVR